jgi:hypothetical protein
MKTLSFNLKKFLFPSLLALMAQSTSALALEKAEDVEWIKNQSESLNQQPSTGASSSAGQPKLPDQTQETILDRFFNQPSPVEKFRLLLEASSSELKAELDAYPEETRSKISVKIAEYRKLSVENRRQKLTATELRWYLPPLLNVDQDTRDFHLKKLEPGLAEVIHQRLMTWDSLPEDLKSSSSKSSLIIGHLSKAPSLNPPLPTPSASGTVASAPKLPKVPGTSVSVNAAAPVSQERLQRLKAYFEMNQEAKNATLKDASLMSDSIFMSRLNWLETMPDQLRERVLSHLIRFQELSAEEKKDFGRSIKTWNRLPQPEKEALRNLVKKTPPFPGKAVQPE